jgi:diguanylate cyclase (GGDEF)-like protein
VGRPGLTTRTRAALERTGEQLSTVRRRVVVLGGGLVVTVGGHAALDEPRLAWLAAPLVLIAGVAGGVKGGFLAAGAAVVGHAVADVVIGGIDEAEVIGILARSAVLPFLGLVGAAGAQLEQQRDRAMNQAISEDPVTRLLNVRVFYDEVDRLRAEGTPFSILLADIRGMRRLNDTYGHPTGTEAMRALAHVLRRAAGADVIASRLGSDEVAALLVGDERQQGQAVVARVVERLRHETVRLPDGQAFEVHAAYGIARWPEDGDDAVALLRAADRAKERAKAAGLDEVGHARGRGGAVELTSPDGEVHPVADAVPPAPRAVPDGARGGDEHDLRP